MCFHRKLTSYLLYEEEIEMGYSLAIEQNALSSWHSGSGVDVCVSGCEFMCVCGHSPMDMRISQRAGLQIS